MTSIEVLKESEIAEGGMKAVKAGAEELVLCRWEGRYYAVSRRCGHAGVFLERGALSGNILTCPLHCAQFDVTSGMALSGPVPEAPDSKYKDPADPSLATHDLKSFRAFARDGSVFVELP